MGNTYQITAVAIEHEREALRFIAAGHRSDATSIARAESLENLISDCERPEVRIYHTVESDSCIAAGMTIIRPGRTAMLFYSPPATDGVSSEALGQTLRRLSRDTIAAGASLVQALIAVGAGADVCLLKATGFTLFVTLIYMKLDLAGIGKPGSAAGLTWKNLDNAGEAELASVIQSTYHGSQDCAGLVGVRDIHDVIEEHKHAGVFRPESWWIVYCDSQPIGCVLLNDSDVTPTSEIVYLGVTPQHRGKGIGQKLLARAASDAKGRHSEAVTLALDAQNHCARRLYDEAGYEETNRRMACIMLAKQAAIDA